MMEKYICLVDAHRTSCTRRNTSGRYIVCAKNEKEAKKILQKAIGFGSISVYYNVADCGFAQEKQLVMKKNEMYKIKIIGENKKDLQFEFLPVEHALSPKK